MALTAGLLVSTADAKAAAALVESVQSGTDFTTDAVRRSKLDQAQALVCSCSICNQAYDELCAGLGDKASQ